MFVNIFVTIPKWLSASFTVQGQSIYWSGCAHSWCISKKFFMKAASFWTSSTVTALYRETRMPPTDLEGPQMQPLRTGASGLMSRPPSFQSPTPLRVMAPEIIVSNSSPENTHRRPRASDISVLINSSQHSEHCAHMWPRLTQLFDESDIQGAESWQVLLCVRTYIFHGA